MRRIPDESGQSLIPFVEDAIELGSLVHIDAGAGIQSLGREGLPAPYHFPKRQKESASDLLPRVYLMSSLLKRCCWTHTKVLLAGSSWTTTWMSSRFASTDENSATTENAAYAGRSKLVAMGVSPYKSKVRCYSRTAASDPNI
jgi:hypothetical protein